MIESRDSASPSSILRRLQELRGLAHAATDVRLTAPSLKDLLRHTRRQLVEYARCVGLTRIHRLTKAALATRLRRELARLVVRARAEASADAPHKFDLGSTSAGVKEEAAHIPWGHGEDRVTAMVVDPENLYVYWEVTDEALERARAELGPGGPEAWLNLRVYDVTDRIFDGTNANHYFDHAVPRTDRQWFFFIGRPSSTVVIELGARSQEGHFVRIARSGRTDFPRREPTSPGGVEWLTVRSAGGEVSEPVPESRDLPAVVSASAGMGDRPEVVRVWDIRRTHGFDGDGIRDESIWTAWEKGGGWALERTVEWEGPMSRSTWEAGPFSYPVEPAVYVEERYELPMTARSADGRSHIVHSEKRVVIRGLGARAERRVLAVWDVHRSWIVHANVLVRTVGEAAHAPGGSEQVLGASERHWRAASELRLGGASELYRLGASELRYRGASEIFYLGASEWRARGASELRYLGASERLQAGASEIPYAGASERLQAGAGERSWPGASENRPRYPAERTDPAQPRG